MSTIPVTVRLDADTFSTLEAIAERRGVTVRQLIQSHVKAGLDRGRTVRPVREGQHRSRSVTDADIARWVGWAEAGRTNQWIADTAGVSKSLVSRYLIERGVRRMKRRAVSGRAT